MRTARGRRRHSARRVRLEHYEMAGYGVARTFATILGEDTADLLQETLDEEARRTRLRRSRRKRIRKAKKRKKCPNCRRVASCITCGTTGWKPVPRNELRHRSPCDFGGVFV